MAVQEVGTDVERYAYDRSGNFDAFTGKWSETEVNMRGVSLVACILIGGMSVFGANGSVDIPLSYVKDGKGTISGLLWDVGNLRRRSVDVGLDDFVYECPIASLSSLRSGHYELDVAVRRHVFVRERWYTNQVVYAESTILSSHPSFTGSLKDMADAIDLTKFGIPISSGLLTREEGIYHLAQTDSDLVTGSDYTAKPFKPQSGQEWAESVFWLNRALFLTKDGLVLLVISRSSPDKPDQAIPLYAMNFDIDDMSKLMSHRFGQGDFIYVHAYFNQGRDFVVYCGRDGWEKLLTLSSQRLSELKEIVSRNYKDGN